MIETMNVALAVLADAANVSQDGKLNILGTFDTIFSDSFPTIHPQCQLVLRLTAKPAESGRTRRITVKLLDADARELLALEGEVKVPERKGPGEIKINSLLSLQNLQFTKPGDYTFNILIDDDQKGEVPFRVIERKLEHPAKPKE